MKTLILCVDRDNDIGRKTNIKSPIIGREDILRATIELGLKDPEDSDVNGLFAAIKKYDEFVKKEKEVEIAVICGDVDVSGIADEIIKKQLEEVLEKVKADELIFVSDGGEDEFIMPIITSRIKIAKVERVIVKQSKSIEGIYYIIMKAIEDKKLAVKFGTPIGLALIVWGIFTVADLYYKGIKETNLYYTGIGAMLLILGIYLLIKVLNIDRMTEKFIRETFTTSKPSSTATLIGLSIAFLGLLQANNYPIIKYGDVFTRNILIFLISAWWWIIVGAIIGASGRILEFYMKDKKVYLLNWMLPFSLFTSGIIVYGVFQYAYAIITETYDPTKWNILLFTYIAGGVLAILIGRLCFMYVKSAIKPKEVEWRQ